jgi:uncharacterized phage protein (TIGR02218 family)
MKNWPAELLDDIANNVPTITICLKLVRADSAIMGFTVYDQSLTIDGVVYNAATSAIETTVISSSSDLSVDNLEINGFLDSEAITESDVLAGVYNFAAFTIFMVNAYDISRGVGVLTAGTLGQIKLEDGKYTAECRSLTQPLQQEIGDLFSPECRANFCDYPAANGCWRCNLDSGDYIVTGTVTQVDAARPRFRFEDSARTEDANTFRGGYFTWTSGNNAGRSMDIKNFSSGGWFALYESMQYDIEAGDAYLAIRGCDKTRATCATFSNVPNFQGEPDLPGIKQILDYMVV